MPPIKIRSGPLDKFLERERAKPFNPSSQMPRMLHQMDGNVARRQKPDITETKKLIVDERESVAGFPKKEGF